MQGMDLVEFGVIQGRALRRERGKTVDRPTGRKRIAQVRGQKRAKSRGALLQSLQEQAYVVQFLRVRRVLQQFDSFLVGRRFLFRNVAESKVLVGAFVREQHAVVEGILRTEIVSQNDVSQFVREYRGKASLIWKHIHQSTADHNGITHAERLQRGSE